MQRVEKADHSAEEIVCHASETTHEMSNSVGTATSLLQTYISEERGQLVHERVIQATELMSRATGELRKLMWELQRLRRSLRGMTGK